MKNLLIVPLIALFLNCGVEKNKVNSRYLSIDTFHNELVVTNVTKDEVFVFAILQETLSSTIPPEITHRYIQKSFTINVNTTKKFKFPNPVSLKFLRTCLIIKSKLGFCLSERF